jgi:hypothetical protein
MSPEKVQLILLHAWIVVPIPEPEKMPSPTPIKCVLGGKTQVVGMTIVPAGNRIVEGTLTDVLPLFQGVHPAAQLIVVLPELRPRASMTAPMEGYEYDDELKIP